MSWLDTLKQYAPSIATAIVTGGTSALPAALIGILGKELIGNENASAQRVEEQLQSYTRQAELDPEIALQLRRADLSFRTRELELIYQDRQSARSRDIQIQKSKGNNYRADGMILMAWLGALACIGALIYLFSTGNPDAGLVAVISTFGTKFLGQIDLSFSFEFGGSADGSKANRNIAAILGRQVKDNKNNA